ncbi:MAG: pyridoxamine 5'-phosphate oxidase family protein [Actinomycetota bacterium]
MTTLDVTAPAFVAMAHRIVWCTAATAGPDGAPRTRVLHPIWEWDGDRLRGWIATVRTPLKAAHLDANPSVSLTYWDPTQDTCTADCGATWIDDDEKAALWARFAEGPEPVGYDPSIVPGWDDADSPAFDGLVLEPRRLRVMPGTVLLQGTGEVLTWSA